MPNPPATLHCRLCGHAHRPVRLAPGERALCVRCNTVLAQGPRLGSDTALAFTITGLILALPAALLPFITAGKAGHEHVGRLFTGAQGLWNHGMPLLAFWVMLCGGLAPAALLIALTALLLPARFGWKPVQPQFLTQAAHALGHWAMPEVQVLAVLVALIKLGKLVTVSIGPGFWFYAALSYALLFAWRSFDLESTRDGSFNTEDPEGPGQNPRRSLSPLR
jgi:paraquat-inducible protein A